MFKEGEKPTVEHTPEGAAILVVDDEESLRLTFKVFLTRAGFGPVVTATTLGEAIAAIKEQDFDLIISDIVFEGASGIDLLRQVREAGLTCPVVMITGYPNVNTAAEAVRLGAFDYLPKPVTKNDLLRAARLALQQSRLQREKERLQADKDRYRTYLETIFRSVRDAIITVDTEMRIVELNEVARRWFRGVLPEAAVGERLDLLVGGMARSCAKDVERVLRTREESREHRIECDWPDGGRSVLSVSAAPLEDGQANFLGVVLVARDVTRLDDLEQRDRRTRFHRLIGKSAVMQAVYTMIDRVGPVDTAVLITGESGTGKELVAEALQAESPRHNKPFVKVDCTSISEEILESELFGHRKGAFTGAERDRLGRILKADGGTLFLDEIGDISPRMQLRLLRFLQEKSFYPVGRDRPIQVDVRVIAATNADLKEKVRSGSFREDLYFRLRVVDIMLPPLRERLEDIPLLVGHFLPRFQGQMGKEISGISDQAIEALQGYSWPGNVRELEHVVERACVLCQGPTITTDHLPEDVARGGGRAPTPSAHIVTGSTPEEGDTGAVGEPTDEAERIRDALRRTAGNKAKAARLLGIDRTTLYRKLREHGIELATTEV